MDPISVAFMFAVALVPGLAVAALESGRGRPRVRPAKLDRARGHVSGTFWIADARACRLVRREGVWAALGSTFDLEGSSICLTDEAGARYELDVAGVAAGVHPSARSSLSPGGSWAPGEGDMVELSGGVIAEAPAAGYRAATQGAFTLLAVEPGKLRLRLLALGAGH